MNIYAESHKLAAMIATIINAAAVILGSLAGLFLEKSVGARSKEVVYIGIGLVSLVIGISMALEGTRIITMALSLVIGGGIGSWLRLEERIVDFGELLKRLFLPRRLHGGAEGAESAGARVGEGFLNASVLFCVGAMAIIGSFKAGVEGDLELLLTKSVMDGFMAVVLTAAMGIGVIFSALTILVYQGGLTLLSAWASPWITDLMLSEITGVGGVTIMMIGINLLGLRKIRTADYIPALPAAALFAGLEPVVLNRLLPVLAGG